MPASRHARYWTETLEDGLCLMSVEATPQHPVPLLLKRALDIAGACVGLAICALAYLVFAPLIRLGSPGPVIFRQTRVGRNGRLFMLYKFRTMGCDAEAQKAALQDGNHMSGFLFKMRGDPRVTAIGHVLRRTYLDELPQFWNVLKGDMSLVGTRPPTMDEAACYAPHHKRRLSVRPGITGLWQVTGNGSITDFEDVVRLDCEYIDRWSIWLDLQILLRTCVTVARMGGH
jgi:lipopolysaccharide/colanic/teichoic acid biosynthesis glycosyltransferase